ncbi:phospholipase B, partial [Scheffersomyces stipitis CBS 6054]
DEKEYTTRRNSKTEISLREFFKNSKIPGFNYDLFSRLKAKPTKIALAFSGGGYRSMLIGAGCVAALDIRNENTSERLGGILQASSYIAGISGGSWLVMSQFVNDFPTIDGLKESWDLEHQLLEGVPSFDPIGIQTQVRIQDNKSGTEIKKEEPLKKKSQEETSFFGNIYSFFVKKTPNQLLLTKDDMNGPSPNNMIVKFMKSMFVNNNNNNSVTPNIKGYTRDTPLEKIFSYYKELQIEVRDKRKAGYQISLTDYWGRTIARRIFRSTARSPGATMSTSIQMSSFQNYEQPFPIITTIERDPRYIETNIDSHQFEITPFEFGSWDSFLNGFLPIKYLGTKLINGSSTSRTDNNSYARCVTGFDNIGFLTGTSSSLFNHIFVYLYQILLDIKSEASTAVGTILKSLGLSSEFRSLMNPSLHPDNAIYSPNPFYGYENKHGCDGRNITSNENLYLFDGGDDGQNIPFQPLLVSSRELDIILAFDLTADYLNYPNGTTLVRSQERFHNRDSKMGTPKFTLASTYNGTTRSSVRSSFPFAPSPEEIVENGLNKRPLFLGCDVYQDYPELDVKWMNNYSSKIDNKNSSFHLPPLIVYYSNGDYGYKANTSTFQLSYSKDEVDGMVSNGINLATFNNSSYYEMCLGCALLKREFDRLELDHKTDAYGNSLFTTPAICRRCYADFCWKGSIRAIR